MYKIFFSYDFLVVALGTIILALSSAMIGCFSVYKGQSLVGDAIGHSSYPGVVLVFMIFQTRNPVFLIVGAAILGAIAYSHINYITKYSKIHLDAALAIVLAGYFGLGAVLKTFTQGNPLYSNVSQAGLKNYIFGSAAFITKVDIYIIIGFCLFSLLLMFLFYKELVVSIFDRDFAKSIGISSNLIDFVLLLMMISIIALGLKSVGAILISSFLIMPCICANQHSKKIKNVLIISSIVGATSSFLGTYLSTVIKGFSTGPTIIVCMSLITFLSMVFGKYGLLKNYLRKEEIKNV